MTKSRIVFFALAAALVGSTGCSTTNDAGSSFQPRLWTSVVNKDEFTDVEYRFVTVGSYYTRSGTVSTLSGRLYPFVGQAKGKLVVGVRSGGTYRVPVGDVQLRIDDNPAWTISTTETPIDILPANPTTAAPEGASAQVAASIAMTQKMVAASMSPFTVTSGEKAESILKQMLNGRVLRYRSVAMGQAYPAGEIPIDASFKEELLKIGVKLPETK